MATPATIEITVGDTSTPKRRTGLIRFRTADQVFPATLQTELSALIATIFGAGLPVNGAMLGARVIIESGDAVINTSGPCDIRDLWKVAGQDASLEPTSFQLPARDLDPALIAAGSVVLADLSATPWLNFLDALATISWKNPKDGDLVNPGVIDARVRSRVRPRIGSVR